MKELVIKKFGLGKPKGLVGWYDNLLFNLEEKKESKRVTKDVFYRNNHSLGLKLS